MIKNEVFIEAMEVAAVWIPDPKSGDPLFAKAARHVLVGLFANLDKRVGEDWGVADLSDLLSLDAKGVFDAAIEGWPRVAGIVTYDSQGPVGRTAEDILTTVTDSLAWVHHAAAVERSAR